MTKKNQMFPVVLGGDHSCAMGTWKAVLKHKPSGFGMLWIDAHLDSHTPKTSDSGALHGMPLAYLLKARNFALPFLGENRSRMAATGQAYPCGSL